MRVLILLLGMFVMGKVTAHTDHIHESDNVTQFSNEVRKVVNLIEQGRASANETFYRQARRLLQSERVKKAVPVVYQAELAQYFHEFDRALVLLGNTNKTSNESLLRANILLTQGKVAEARTACKKINNQQHPVISMICLAKVASLNGMLPRSQKMLEYIIRHNQQASPSVLHWAQVTAAEMAERAGEVERAKKYYIKALELKQTDMTSRMALADILLEQKQYKQVEKLTYDYLENDGLLLRYVRALNIQGDLRTSSHFCGLKRRMLNYTKEKKHLHYDTLAEYYYYFNQGNEQAMQWAVKHWQQQKTPRDARLLAKIAASQFNEPALDSITSWQAENKTEDKLLGKILQQVLI